MALTFGLLFNAPPPTPVDPIRLSSIDWSSPVRALASVPGTLLDGLRAAGGWLLHVGGAGVAAAEEPERTEVASLRTRDSKTFRNADGTYTAEFGHGLHYEASPGDWREVDLDFRRDGNEWVADRNEVIVRVTSTGVKATNRDTGKGVLWKTPAAATVSGRKATFAGPHGLSFTYSNTPDGLKLEATVSDPIGAKTFAFDYSLAGGAAPFVVDEQGNLVSDQFLVPRALATGADDKTYVAGVWRIVGTKVAFDFDDSAFPSQAYPYTLDPSTSFQENLSSEEDDTASKSDTAYPPGGSVSTFPTSTRINVVREKVSGTYTIANGFVRWDTSGLPNTAVVTAATLRLDLTYVRDADGKVMTADWYPSSNWPIGTSDYTSGSATTASGAGWDLDAMSSGDNDFALASPDGNVSLTGDTGIRLHLSSGQPAGENRVHFKSRDDSVTAGPRLLADYVLPLDPCTRAATPAPEDWAATAEAEGASASGHEAEVSLKTGQLALQVEDDAVPGRGLAPSFIRSYNSASTADRILGPGWRSSLEESVCPQGDGSVIHVDGSGRERRFLPDGAGGFTAPAGVYDALTLILGVRYVLTDPEGIEKVFDPFGHLGSVTDPNGNALVIIHDETRRPQYVCAIPEDGELCDETNADLMLAYDTLGRLSELTDVAGDSWTYAYDGSGRLASVTDPEDGVTSYAYDASSRLTTLTDAEGGQAKLTYDGTGRIASVKDPEAEATGGPATTFSYDTPSAGKVTVRSPEAAGASPLGAGEVHQVGSGGQLLSLTDPLGKTTTYAYDANFNLTSETDALGKTTSYAYDARGNLTSETDPLGGVTSYTYDAANNLLTETDPRGKTTTYTYGSARNLLTATDPLGAKTTYTYDSFGQVLTEKDPRAKITTFAYDAKGNRTETTDPLGKKTTYVYDAAGNLLTQTDPLGNTTSYTYDKLGNVLSETDPEGGKTTFTYDKLGRQVTEVDPVGNVTGNDPAQYTSTTAYDRAGRVMAETDALGNETNYVYDADGHLESKADPRGNVTTYDHDAAHRVVKETAPDGGETTVTYDAVGRVTSATDPKGTTTFTYDAVGRKLSETDPLGGKTTFTYDAAGNLLSRTDPAGNISGAPASSYTTTYIYDDAGQLTSITDPASNETTYAYDAVGNQTSITDPAGATTTFTYDALNRETNRQTPGSETRNATGTVDPVLTPEARVNVSLPAAGTIQAALTWEPPTVAGHEVPVEVDLDLSLLNAAGATVAEASDHDAHTETLVHAVAPGSYTLRIATKDFGAAWRLDYGLPATQSKSTSYDAASRETSTSDAAGTTTYNYDKASRIKQVQMPDPAVQTFAYDKAGRTTSVTDPSGTQSFTYDRAGRLASATDQSGVTTTYAHDAAGNETTVTHAGQPFTFAYDSANRVSSRTESDGVTKAQFAYADKVHRTRTTHAAGDVDAYAFDGAGRLTDMELKSSASASATLDRGFTYDVQGNLIEVTEDQGANTIMRASYEYDTLDRLTDETLRVGGGDRTFTYAYDAQGNRTEVTGPEGTTTFMSNPAGQLASQEDPSGALTIFLYDGRGNLVQAIGSAGATAYAWTGNGKLASVTEPDGTQVSYTYDRTGRRTKKTAGATVTTYAYENGRLASTTTSGQTVSFTYDETGAPLSIAAGGQTYSYRTDERGSVIELTDANHDAAATYQYDAWGNLVAATGPAALRDANLYTFIGAHGVLFDQETGIYQMGARYYDPRLARFLSRDPIDAYSNETSYGYGGNNPVVRIDPSGLRHRRTESCREAPGWDCRTPPSYRRWGRQIWDFIQMDLQRFKRRRASGRSYAQFVWSTDGCSVPRWLRWAIRKNWRAFFFAACTHHDFGYRNLKAHEIHYDRNSWNFIAKYIVDTVLLRDARSECIRRMPRNFRLIKCLTRAKRLYIGVRFAS